MADLTYRTAWGRLDSFDGEPGVVAVFTSLYSPSIEDPDLASIDANEIDVSDAPGYERVDVTMAWDGTGITVTVPPTFDLDGADDVRHLVLAADDGSLVGRLELAASIEGVDGYAVPVGVYWVQVGDAAGIATRLSTVEAVVAALDDAPSDGIESVTGTGVSTVDSAVTVSGIPAPAGSTAGQVWTSTGPSSPAEWAAVPGGGGGAAGIVEVDLSAETGSWVECNLSELPVAGTYRVEPPADVDCTIEFVYPDLLTRPPTVIIIGSSPVKVGVYSPPIPQVNQPKTLLITPSSAGGGRHGAWLDPIWWDGVSATDGQTLEIVDGAPVWVTP